MGKYPFKEFADQYMEKMSAVYSPETTANRIRRYNRMNAFVVDLKDRKIISTSSPKQFTEKDIEVIIRRDRELRSPSDMVHEVNALRKLCRFCGNMNLDLCLDRNPELKPRIKGNRRKGTMQDETYQAILEKALEIDPADWMRLRAYALVLLCLDAGTRNKEIRFAEVGDLDTKAWTLDIIHVKGEATYGEARVVPIREEIRPVVARYLAARARWAAEHGCASKALFPSGDGRSDGFMCGNSLRRMKDLVEDELHIRFDLRECRRTFGQRYLDSDLEISSVSVLMGHATTKTTERFYGRQKNRMAIEKARATWSASSEGTSMTGEGSEGASRGAMVDNESSVTPSKTPSPLVDNVASVTDSDGGQSQEIGRQAP